MSDPKQDNKVTRRTALVAAGTAATAVWWEGTTMSATKTKKMPAVYLPHGGGPWNIMDQPWGEPDSLARLTKYLQSLPSVPAEKPRAALVISAHWEEDVATVMTAARPPMLYDYYGFPEHTYQVQWSAPGAPNVAARVAELLDGAGVKVASAPDRGFDHGTFVPMMVAYPKADIPTVQLSLVKGLDPEAHLALGRALAPLREEGVYIVGSGMSFHNMRAFKSNNGAAMSKPFDDWLAETVVLPKPDREARLAKWANAPGAREAHPREEHLLPLMVVAGSAGDDAGRVPYRDTLMSARILAAHFG